MKHKTLLPYLLLVLLLTSSCQNMPPHEQSFAEDTAVKISPTTMTLPDSGQLVGSNSSLTGAFVEDFEQAAAVKSSYVTAEVTFKSGAWLLTDALLASSQADIKNGGHAVRIRNTGKLKMQFDLSKVTVIRVLHAIYGHDAASSWQLWVSKDKGKQYEQVGETILSKTASLTPATFSVHANGPLRFEIRKISGGKNRINIDDIEMEGVGITGTPVTKTEATEGRIAINQNIASDDQQLLLGNPSAATSTVNNSNNYLINHQYYIESYSRTKAAPNWVSWHISAKDLGNAKRANDFRADLTLPAGWYEADNTSYKGSGFDKGHNCPSGDRTSSSSANSSTFLMTNMVPQAPNNNQHTWEHLESYCRDQVKKGKEVYVVMGSYGSGGTGTNGYRTTIDNGRINVPSHIWKVAVIIPEGNDDLRRINTDTQVIAIDTPNDNSVSGNWMDYSCTVRDIEKATGYNLLSALPKKVQDVVEIRKFKGGN